MKQHALIMGFICLAAAGNVAAGKIENNLIRSSIQGALIGVTFSVGTSLGVRQANKNNLEALRKAFDETCRGR